MDRRPTRPARDHHSSAAVVPCRPPSCYERVLLRVSVAVPTEHGDREAREFDALVDTGAQCTMVSHAVVDQVGASLVGFLPFTPANGQPQWTEVYELSVGVVASETGTLTCSKTKLAPVLLLPFDPPDYDVLLGQDHSRHPRVM